MPVVVDFNLPFDSDRSRKWAGSGAKTRMAKACRGSGDGVNFSCYQRGFIWRNPDMDSETQGAYKLPVADVIGGRLMIVLSGLQAAANAVSPEREPGEPRALQAPESALREIRGALDRLYARAREAYDDESIRSPWERRSEMASACVHTVDECDCSCEEELVISDLPAPEGAAEETVEASGCVPCGDDSGVSGEEDAAGEEPVDEAEGKTVKVNVETGPLAELVGQRIEAWLASNGHDLVKKEEAASEKEPVVASGGDLDAVVARLDQLAAVVESTLTAGCGCGKDEKPAHDKEQDESPQQVETVEITPVSDAPSQPVAVPLPLSASALLAPVLRASATDLWRPPREHFQNPKLGAGDVQKIQLTSDGRVFGRLALWDQAHIGYDGQQVFPPRDPREGLYASFRKARVLPEGSDEEIPVGLITMNTGHAGAELNAAQATSHYDNTSTIVAAVNIGEDELGIWMSGSLLPGVSEVDRIKLSLADVSGDWREVEPGRGLELVAALSVPSGGFPVRLPEDELAKDRLTLAASAVTHTTVDGDGNERLTTFIPFPSRPVTSESFEDRVVAALQRYESDKEEKRKRSERLRKAQEKLRAERRAARQRMLRAAVVAGGGLGKA